MVTGLYYLALLSSPRNNARQFQRTFPMYKITFCHGGYRTLLIRLWEDEKHDDSLYLFFSKSLIFFQGLDRKMPTWRHAMCILFLRNIATVIIFLSFKGSTCVVGFAQCNSDPNCRLRMTEFINMCVWNTRTNTCNRGHCLAAIRKFYLLVRPEKTHALLFCQCKPGDYKCEVIRQGLYPTCSTVETPPPSCLSIIDRCEMDLDCR